MVGEYGGLGAFISGHEWVPSRCETYLKTKTPHDEATECLFFVAMYLNAAKLYL
jgi:hypothetical protein